MSTITYRPTYPSTSGPGVYVFDMPPGGFTGWWFDLFCYWVEAVACARVWTIDHLLLVEIPNDASAFKVVHELPRFSVQAARDFDRAYRGEL